MKTICLKFFFLIGFFLPTNSVGQTNQSDLNTKLAELDDFLSMAQGEVGFPGIAFAVMQGEEVILQKNLGYANLEHKVAVSHNTVFPLYSLTKPFIAVGVFSLIENGKLTLDDFASNYVDGLPDSWKNVQIKHLLSHSSGLPDMAGSNPYEIRDFTKEQAKDRVFEMPLIFQKGEKYAYNQTNFWLLKEIIEKVSGEELSDFIIHNQFPNANDEGVFFSADAREVIPGRATAYFPWVKGKLMIDTPYANGDYFLACNGFHITLENFIQWDQRLRTNHLISEASRNAMWKLFDYTNSEKSFAYGWEVTNLNNEIGYGFSGAMATFYRTYPKKNISIIFLSNGFASMYNQDALANGISSIMLGQ
ncbi:serine hydrolase domain-containing protein [Roseivirga sp. 4D4]|uniref:serine hydrolase domain-containing protein n=1 Tax=Roseivirga sp. 4D4 TaxID=1889784 RepID=UPI00147C7C4C|nr:serine hydrolase domain-containing protein [Roseivirga sp. 4D4]